LFENRKDIEINIISPHEYINSDRHFEIRGIHYHFFNAHIPFWGRHWPGFFKFDYWTFFFFKRQKHLHMKHINEIEDIDNLLGTNKGESRPRGMVEIDVRDIEVDWSFNSRDVYEDIEGLAESIKQFGLIHPLTVAFIKETGKYLLVDGHRRYQALMLLLEKGVPIGRVRANLSSSSPEDRLAKMLITGIHKKTLHPVEQANSFKRLQNYGWSVQKIASMLSEDGKNKQNMVYRYLKLADAPEAVKQRCLKGEISHDTVIKIIEDAEGDYDTVVSTVEDAIAANTTVTETGEVVVAKVKTRQVAAIKKPKPITFMAKVRTASDELFESSEENELLEEFLSLENKEASIEEIKAFFGTLVRK
jgi:ParB/RepB/Spo0J family partition protein